MNDGELRELRKSHLAALSRLASRLPNGERVCEHVDVLHNSIEDREVEQADREKSKTIRVNENLIAESRKKSKSFEIDWNLEYCNACRVSYWPRNCRVFIVPKFGISRASARLYARHKLLNIAPKYKSFREKLLANIKNRSMRLVYECKRCGTRNLIVKELNRPAPRTMQLGHQKKKKILQPVDKKDKKNSIQIKENKLHQSQLPRLLPQPSPRVPPVNHPPRPVIEFNKRPPPVTTNDSLKSRDKKFKSLQAKLKHSELEQEAAKNQKKTSLGSLADFLQKLT